MNNPSLSHNSPPILTIAGRPNVGKSTLFNCLTGSRHALVANMPGVTRDRQYGHATRNGQPFIVIDTGGLTTQNSNALNTLTAQQTHQALLESNIILFMVSAKSGITQEDDLILEKLRHYDTPIHLVVNKIDGVDSLEAETLFQDWGIKTIHYISAAHKRGIKTLIDKALDTLTPEPKALWTANLPPLYAGYLPTHTHPSKISSTQNQGIYLAIIGRPNVGKSTLVNRLLGQERVLVSDIAGTTRDSLYLPLSWKKHHYVLVDTAGIRRRPKVKEAIEKFSIIKSLQAIANSHVCIVLISAITDVTDQDLRLLRFVLEAGKGLVVGINKWDAISTETQKIVKMHLKQRLQFIQFANTHFISAKKGRGINPLLSSVHQAYVSATRELSTAQLTRILEKATKAHEPPLIKGRRIKLRYAHPGGYNPPCIIIHGKQVTQLPLVYRRYLANFFQQALHLVGTPLRLIFKTDSNPYRP